MEEQDSNYIRNIKYWYALTHDLVGAYQYANDMFDFWYLGICKPIDHNWFYYGTNCKSTT